MRSRFVDILLKESDEDFIDWEGYTHAATFSSEWSDKKPFGSQVRCVINFSAFASGAKGDVTVRFTPSEAPNKYYIAALVGCLYSANGTYSLPIHLCLSYPEQSQNPKTIEDWKSAISGWVRDRWSPIFSFEDRAGHAVLNFTMARDYFYRDCQQVMGLLYALVRRKW